MRTQCISDLQRFETFRNLAFYEISTRVMRPMLTMVNNVQVIISVIPHIV